MTLAKAVHRVPGCTSIHGTSVSENSRIGPGLMRYRIRGWPGITGFTLGVAIAVKAQFFTVAVTMEECLPLHSRRSDSSRQI